MREAQARARAQAQARVDESASAGTVEDTSACSHGTYAGLSQVVMLLTGAGDCVAAYGRYGGAGAAYGRGDASSI